VSGSSGFEVHHEDYGSTCGASDRVGDAESLDRGASGTNKDGPDSLKVPALTPPSLSPSAGEAVTTSMVTMIYFQLSACRFEIRKERCAGGIHKTTQPDVCSGGKGGLV
jgi:hypothetical protein